MGEQFFFLISGEEYRGECEFGGGIERKDWQTAHGIRSVEREECSLGKSTGTGTEGEQRAIECHSTGHG